jgi:hypothetical protein
MEYNQLLPWQLSCPIFTSYFKVNIVIDVCAHSTSTLFKHLPYRKAISVYDTNIPPVPSANR